MPTPRISRALAEEAHAHVAAHGSIEHAAKALGANPNMLRGRYYAAIERFGMDEVRHSVPRPLAFAQPPAPDGFVVSGHSAQTDADGNVERQWTRSKPAPGEPFTPIEGHVIKGESALVDGEGRLLARWIKTKEGPSAHLAEALREAFAEFEGLVPAVPPPEVADVELLTLYPVPDLHLGMYAWGRETGEDYDIAIATARAVEGIDYLIGQSLPSARAIILVLGDYLHADNQKNATPMSGHQLDMDGRRMKVYRAGVDLLMRMVERAKAKHQAVEIVVIPGNHDPDSALTITVAMSLAYSADDRVTVADGPNSVWYCRFGRVLFGATHGHTMKPDRMAMMLANDRPEDWGQTWHKHFFFGHVHHKTAEEVGPVQVESFGTPASRDAYAHGAGYRASRYMTAITFHRERGEVGRHRRAVLPKKSRVRVKAA